MSENDDSQNGANDPATGLALDAWIVQDLSPGWYVVTLTQYGNSPIGSYLWNGFSETGNPSFTSNPGFAPGGPCLGDVFKDSSGSCRGGGYFVEFSNVTNVTETFVETSAPYRLPSLAASGSEVSTPEPGTFLLFVVPLMWFLWAGRARRVSQSSRG